MLYLDVLASPLVAGCLLRASQAENAGSIPVARSRQTSQVKLGVASASAYVGNSQNRGRATNVPQRATRSGASSATKAEDAFGWPLSVLSLLCILIPVNEALLGRSRPPEDALWTQ